MELPKISEEKNLSLTQAKQEYIQLTTFLKDNRPKHGWLESILIRYNQRLDFLKTTITEKVCFDNKEKKNGK